jgi:hypothetical protein
LRYHPDAERYLVLGDFTFWAMKLERLRYIGGFGAMGWLSGAELDSLPPLGVDEENALIEEFNRAYGGGGAFQLLGVDRYGADLKLAGVRKRLAFDDAGLTPETLHTALEGCIKRQTN